MSLQWGLQPLSAVSHTHDIQLQYACTCAYLFLVNSHISFRLSLLSVFIADTQYNLKRALFIMSLLCWPMDNGIRSIFCAFDLCTQSQIQETLINKKQQLAGFTLHFINYVLIARLIQYNVPQLVSPLTYNFCTIP